jgi:hypothetical protein
MIIMQIKHRAKLISGTGIEVTLYKGVPKSFWIGHLKQEMQMVQLSATMYSCITIL